VLSTDRFIYLLDGLSFRQFDPSTGQWTLLSPPGSLSNPLLLLGGAITSLAPSGGSQVYDVLTDSWSPVNIQQLEASHNPPHLNGVQTSVEGNTLFAIERGTYFQGTYLPAGGTRTASISWTQPFKLPAGAPQVVPMAISGGKLFVFGFGPTRTGAYQLVVAGPPVVLAPSPAAVDGDSATGANGKIYLVGGIANNSAWDGVDLRYDPSSDSWSRGAPLAFSTNHPILVSNVELIHALGENVSGPGLGNHQALTQGTYFIFKKN
jgi:hypothetical protein